MSRNRIVVGAADAGDDVFRVARRLRDAGHEVVLVGGGQSPEQLLRTALAEDADEIVLCGEYDAAALDGARKSLEFEHVRITPAADVTDPTRQEPP